MSEPYVGEIRLFAGNFGPAGWMLCEGQLLPISENETLYALLGTTYGGDGESTFALPDLRGRVPIHQGNGFTLAETGGVEDVTLTVSQIPTHTHAFLTVGAQGTSPNPSGQLLAGSPNVSVFTADIANQPLASQSMSAVGGSQPHTNFQPYLCVNYIIALFGIYPSPS
jgi:microcystin-dependent protein